MQTKDYFISPDKTNDIGYKKPFKIASFERNVINLNQGVWTMQTQKGEKIQTENLKEFEGVPGILITNSIHNFGFKYNNLYNIWKYYDFKNEKFI
jgi:hypothetical protein